MNKRSLKMLVGQGFTKSLITVNSTYFYAIYPIFSLLW
jgi:hypothetical protein